MHGYKLVPVDGKDFPAYEENEDLLRNAERYLERALENIKRYRALPVEQKNFGERGLIFCLEKASDTAGKISEELMDCKKSKE